MTIRAGEIYAPDRDIGAAETPVLWTGADRETFVAGTDGSVLGSCYLPANRARGGAHVADFGLVTRAEMAGRGVARTMGAHSLDRAVARGFPAIPLNLVVSTNARAVRLWDSLGFDVVGRRSEAFRPPNLGRVDALVMFRTP